jgi:hypothetical protein
MLEELAKVKRAWSRISKSAARLGYGMRCNFQDFLLGRFLQLIVSDFQRFLPRIIANDQIRYLSRLAKPSPFDGAPVTHV